MRLSLSVAALSLGTAALPSHAVEIEVGYAYASLFDTPMAQIVEGFRQQHPDIEVKFRATYEHYEDATNTVLREAVAGTLPDVSFQGLNRQAILVERGIARPLDPFIAAEADFDADGYHAAMLKLSTFDDTIYGLPFSVSTPIAYYNMDLMHAVGIDRIPVTWEEVVADCGRLAAGGAPALYWDWSIAGNWLLQAAMWSQGVPMIEDSKFNLDNPEGLKALETAQAIFADCGMQNISIADAGRIFASGELAMMFTTTAYVDTIHRTKTGDWDFVTAPYPGIGGAPKALPAGGNAAMIVSQSTDPDVLEAAWQFVKYATSGEGAAIVARTTGYIPPNRVANEVLLKDFYTENPTKETAVKQLPLLSEWFAYPGDNGLAITQTITDHLEAILLGDATDMAALRDEMMEEVEELLP